MLPKIRVLMIGPYPFQEDKIIGGVESVTHTLVHLLAQQPDVEAVGVICFHRGQIESHQRQLNERLKVWFVRAQDHFNVLTRQILEVWHARRIAAEFKPNVAHGQGIGGRGEVAMLTHPASVATVHGLEHVEAKLSVQNWRGHIRAHLVTSRVKRVLRATKVIISISHYDARALEHLIGGQHVNISNPIQAQFFAEPSFHSGHKRLLFAGTLVPRKNILGLLRAFALARGQVPEAQLILVGPQLDPVYLEQIRATIAQLSLDDGVQLKGLITQEQLLDELRCCRAVTLFSHEETLPTIVAQALAMGKPVIASQVGGLSEMIQDGVTGFLVEPGNELLFAEQLVTLLSSPELCSQMGVQGHAFAQSNFAPAAVVRQTIEAYDLARRLALEK